MMRMTVEGRCLIFVSCEMINMMLLKVLDCEGLCISLREKRQETFYPHSIASGKTNKTEKWLFSLRINISWHERQMLTFLMIPSLFSCFDKHHLSLSPPRCTLDILIGCLYKIDAWEEEEREKILCKGFYPRNELLSFWHPAVYEKDTKCEWREEKSGEGKEELSLMMMTRNREDVTKLPTSLPLFSMKISCVLWWQGIWLSFSLLLSFSLMPFILSFLLWSFSW